MKTLEYPLAVITLTKKQWDYILSPALCASLPRSGLVRTFKRDVVHGSLLTGGLAFKHPFVLQYIRQLSALLHQMQHPSMLTPQLMLATLEQVVLEIGIGGPIGDIPMPVVSCYMTESWWKDLLVYLYQQDIQLRTSHVALPLNTLDDEYLMNLFIRHGYKGKKLSQKPVYGILLIQQ